MVMFMFLVMKLGEWDESDEVRHVQYSWALWQKSLFGNNPGLMRAVDGRIQAES